MIATSSNGYPPVSVESVWATPVADGFRIENIPFFATQAALGDVVVADRSDDYLSFRGVLQSGGHSLARLVFFDPSKLDEVNAELVKAGCATEWMGGGFKLLAVDIPPGVSIDPFLAIVNRWSNAGSIDCEIPIDLHQL